MVTVRDFAFSPDPIEVAAGGRITWANDDAVTHTATVDGGPDTGPIVGGAMVTLTFDTPGTYTYLCRFHPGTMRGTIVVR